VDVWALVLPHFAVVSSAKRAVNAVPIAASALQIAAERRASLQRERWTISDWWEVELVKTDTSLSANGPHVDCCPRRRSRNPRAPTPHTSQFAQETYQHFQLYDERLCIVKNVNEVHKVARKVCECTY